MKVAIVHDYIKEYGGAERVLETLCEIWPDAEIYTSIYLPEFLGPHKDRFKNYKIHSSFLQQIPFKEKLISVFRFVGPWVFKTFDLSKYDVVIVSQAGTFVSPNLIEKNARSLEITYCHTPPRWLYGYSTAGGWEAGWKKLLKNITGNIPLDIFKKIDFKAAQLPDFYIANSDEVASRITKFYKRNSTVIYPPVDISTPKTGISKSETRSYYLAGGRLARPKRIDLAVKACTKLGLHLKIFGKGFGGYGKELTKIAGPTIEFLGEVNDAQKIELMRNAKAFIFPSVDEDFGITPVEAMGVGTPVIAFRNGGVKETVVENKTGVFFDQQTEQSLSTAIKYFNDLNHRSITAENCITQAKKFSKERFKKEMLQFVSSKLK